MCRAQLLPRKEVSIIGQPGKPQPGLSEAEESPRHFSQFLVQVALQFFAKIAALKSPFNYFY